MKMPKINVYFRCAEFFITLAISSKFVMDVLQEVTADKL